MLSQKELKRYLHYNSETGIFTWLIAASNSVKISAIAGSLKADGYISINVNYKSYQAHRLAWLYVHGKFPNEFIDHINGIKADNRIVNLREATPEENSQNKRKAQFNNKSSGLLGVTWHNKTQKWQATIMINSKSIYLGLFLCKHEAHNAYLTKKRELHNFCDI